MNQLPCFFTQFQIVKQQNNSNIIFIHFNLHNSNSSLTVFQQLLTRECCGSITRHSIVLMYCLLIGSVYILIYLKNIVIFIAIKQENEIGKENNYSMRTANRINIGSKSTAFQEGKQIGRHMAENSRYIVISWSDFIQHH